MNPIIHILPDSTALAHAAAEAITSAIEVALAAHAASETRSFTLCLSGGSTPEVVYRLLAAAPFCERIDWQQVHLFWGDDRHVPPDHADSNYLMVREALLDHVAIPAHNVHRMRSELPAAQAAADYEAELHTVFGDELPRFDLVLMGLGEDGHTASLFPHTTVLHERTRWVAENTVPQLNIERITLTIPVFNNAAAMLFLVAGASKAEAVAAILEGAPDPETYPTQFIQPTNGTLTWLLDVPAAAQLQRLPEQPGTSS